MSWWNPFQGSALNPAGYGSNPDPAGVFGGSASSQPPPMQDTPQGQNDRGDYFGGNNAPRSGLGGLMQPNPNTGVVGPQGGFSGYPGPQVGSTAWQDARQAGQHPVMDWMRSQHPNMGQGPMQHPWQGMGQSQGQPGNTGVVPPNMGSSYGSGIYGLRQPRPLIRG